MEWEENIKALFVLGTAIMIFFAAFVIILAIVFSRRFSRLKKEESDKLLKAVLETERRERKHISDYLHHTISNDIYAVRLNLDFVATDVMDSEKQKALVMAKELLLNIYEQTRVLTYTTLSPILGFTGLGPALHEYFDRFKKQHNLQISFRYPEELPKLDLSISYEVYRILQEILTNMVEHGRVTEATVHFAQNAGQLIITIHDNGIPFNIRKHLKSTEGLGLRNIYSRLQQISAVLKQEKTIKGNSLIITFPIRHD